MSQTRRHCPRLPKKPFRLPLHQAVVEETAKSASGVSDLPGLQSEIIQSREISNVSAVAQYDYEKDEDNEVSFEEGDVIVDIEFVDEDWWSGKNSRTGVTGVFPGSYVTLEEPSIAQTDKNTPPVPSRQTNEPHVKSNGRSAIAEYDYEKEEDNEIGFSEGDLIVEIEFVDEDWWSGKHSVTGEVGVFPGNFVALQ
ncbi:hypothetical protein JCM33374_g545 [Metschnikowia sp. JCM 33374]|nr:hypothetical protein JCM33374_g545 [Metschnikowia sp. JCM 33374]